MDDPFKIVVTIVKAGYGKKVVKAVEALGWGSQVVRGEGSVDPILPMFLVGLTTNLRRDVVFTLVSGTDVEAVQEQGVLCGRLSKKHQGISFVIDGADRVDNSVVRKVGLDV